MEVIIRKSEGEGRFKEVRIAVIGNVDTGNHSAWCVVQGWTR